nr:PREDICTED: PGC-1 and ERR-induced regulator in muscle protein 1 [Rhinolophus sinicus]XP_019567717.1 PREDICTED: PGC-1 and ERR-induced regulator in muscle protein 1 [Rhinolophus sinicus]XP_019567718.1 PREDICTED: PGC-1 and ERR-induced regulator in muscle protein 1 [Rhinolophus sinicus]
MENFQYSIQLSDQDWAEFSATAEECGLLQAGLASGDELLSSDIDQGDSSGSSPPEHLPLLGRQLAPRGRGWPGFEEEDKAATQQLVSRSWQEPVLALGAGQQMPSTSAPSEAQPSLSPGDAPPGQSPSLLGPVTSRDEMQRLLQGPAARDPAPSVPGEPPRSPESPGRSTASQKPPGSPGAPPRSSPSRKKRRAAGTKGGGRPGVAGSAPTQLGSPRLSEARPKEGLGPAGSRGKGLSAGTAEQTAGAGQDKLGPESAGAQEQGARQGPGLDLSTTEQGTDLLGMTPRAELHTVSMPAQETGPDIAMAKSDTALSPPALKPQADSALSTPALKPQTDSALSTPALKPQTDMALSTPAFKPQADSALSTPALKPQADWALSTPALKPQDDLALSTPALKPQADMTLSLPALKPQADTALSTPAHKPQADSALSIPARKPQADSALSTPAYNSRLDADLPALGPVVKPEVDSSIPVSKAQSEVGASTFALSPQAGPDMMETKVVPSAKLDLSSAVSSGGHQEKPRGQPSAGDPENHSGEPPPGSVQAPKKKKVRFSVAVPSPEELGSGEASGPLSPATAWPSAPRTAAGGRGGPGAWDAVAVGPRPPQPRILKHLPPPPSAASGGPGYRSCFAVTLPEAYEFFFCDTIAEEDEEAEEAAEASQVPANVQWPDVCEFFFRDCQAQTSGLRARRSPTPPLKAEPVPAPVPGDPMPISIPEAYEHFLGEDRLGDVLGPASLQLQAAELPRPAPQGVESGTPPETSQATAEQLDLVVRQAGEPRGPLTAFTFSQNDMCLVFVAFATWAVRTSDLHTPDAWKTVLLANIGTISAIRYFRRQVGRGRPSPSPSPSPSS